MTPRKPKTQTQAGESPRPSRRRKAPAQAAPASPADAQPAPARKRARRPRRPRLTRAQLAVRWLFRALAAAAAVLLAAFAWHAGQVVWYKYNDPLMTPYMASRATALERKVEHRWVGIGAMQPQLVAAVIAAEDPGFRSHHGVSWSHAAEGLKAALAGRPAPAGGSSITEQTVRNLVLDIRPGYLRKAEEIVLALFMDALWSKERILEVYLNVAEFGPGCFGAEAAAWRYFHVPARRLDFAQSVWLAAVLPRPLHFAANPSDPALKARIDRIEARLEAGPGGAP
ncbi:MAG: monofunctional biosynthetic peptidoglycan transglycosylase [Duodenibacillus sp.]|nr:monofunctional biosynthetic peptidoglycan transglycosylase [Duodenibacillus sp.]